MKPLRRTRGAPADADVTLDPLSREEVTAAVLAATLAPSVLNTQPWQFIARHHSIELHRDTGRVLRAVDPYHRAITISCGAALFNLRLALAELGRRPDVELLPDGPRSSLLARVTVAVPAQPPGDATQCRLAAAMPQRHTARVPFLNEPLPPEVVIRLEEAAAAESTTFSVLSADAALDVSHLVLEADRAQLADDELRAEIQRWVNRGPAAVDGIPIQALGPTPSSSASLTRDFAMGSPVPKRATADFERQPTLGILLTHDDEPSAWVHAGQGLERVWLEATATGLTVSLLTQPLEVSILRWLARPLTSGSAGSLADTTSGAKVSSSMWARPYWPQVLMRIGVARGHTPATPRRPLSDVLTFA